MKTTLSFLLIVSIFFSGCISNYKGREPDFTLKGAEAQKEYDKFHFDEGYWFQSSVAFTMGPERTAVPYKVESLKPIIKEVSPEAWDIYKRSRVWRQVGGISLLAAGGLLIAMAVDSNHGSWSKDQTIGYYSLLGISLGTSFAVPFFMSSSAERYNQDLRRKFTPALSLNYGF